MTKPNLSNRRLALAAGLMLLVAAAPAPAADVKGEGTLSLRYRSATGTEGAPSSDGIDADAWARLDFRNAWDGKADGHLTARGFKDFERNAPGDPLAGLPDTYSDRDDYRLYEGFLVLRASSRPLSLSVGRQHLPFGPGPAQTFDGLSAEARLPGGRAAVTLFGGARVSHYGEPGRDGIYGARAAWKPWRGALLEASDIRYTWHRWELAAVQSFGGQSLAARFAAVEGDPESVRIDGHFHGPAGIGATLGYFRKIGSGEGRKSFPFDFTDRDGNVLSRLRLGEEKPFADYSALLAKSFGARVELAAGGSRRKLIHDSDEDAFNRSEWTVEGRASLRDLLVPGSAAWVRYRHLWEDRLRTDDGSSGSTSAGVSIPLPAGTSVGAELFASSTAGTAAEPILAEGAARIDRDERGGAVWGRWSGKTASCDLRYEAAEDDLYETYGTRRLHSLTLSVRKTL